MSLEQSLLTHAEALNANSAAMLTLAAALAASGGAGAATATAGSKASSTEGKADAKESAADKKPAAEKKPTAAEKKAAADAKKKAEITDERLTEVFGPLLAKGQDDEVLKANKEFVASVNAHFGVTKLRELTSQEDRAQAVEWGLARAEDGDFEIPAGEEDDDNGV